MERKRYQVYISDDLADWLTERASRGHVTSGGGAATVPRAAAHELGRWRAHLAAELRSTTWTLGQLGCLADVLNGSIITDDATGAVIALELQDAFEGTEGAYGVKWGIDEDALLAKAGALGPTASTVLADTVAAWWKSSSEHTAEAWTDLGVRVAPNPTS